MAEFKELVIRTRVDGEVAEQTKKLHEGLNRIGGIDVGKNLENVNRHIGLTNRQIVEFVGSLNQGPSALLGLVGRLGLVGFGIQTLARTAIGAIETIDQKAQKILHDGRAVWDVDELRAAFKALPHEGESEKVDTWADVV